MARKRELSGQKFGMLTVLERTVRTENGYCVWRCRCDCGREIEVNTKKLVRGSVTNCGCIPKTTARRGSVAEDLTGRRFGRLTVLWRAKNKKGRTCWLCRCDCGGEKEVTAHDLKAGKVKSCGCSIHESKRNQVDLTGRRFGRLRAVCPTSRRDSKGSVYWRCICDCGRETEVTEAGLVHGNCRSCGCLKAENQKNISKQLHLVDGTCVEMLEKRKYRKDNTSGFRGVYRSKSGKYRVDIGFKGRKFYVGSFEDFDEAVEARLSAERLVHDGFVQAYYRWNEKAKADPQWGKEHPLRFNVYKMNGNLEVEIGTECG